MELAKHLQVTKRLGGGGQGSIFLCTNTKQNCTVVVKTIPFEEAQELNSALQESLLLASLIHKNIITTYETFVVEHAMLGHVLCISMPHYKSDLAKFCESNMPLSEENILQIGVQIAKALDFCHAKNIVHRDIKPENILLNDLNSIVVADFGLSKNIQKTTKQSYVGTVNYMAPEIMQQEAYSALVDTFSLGMLLFKLMTNKNKNIIVERATKEATFMQNMQQDMSNYSYSLRMLVMDMIELDPKQRPTMKQVISRLEEPQFSEPFVAPVTKVSSYKRDAKQPTTAAWTNPAPSKLADKKSVSLPTLGPSEYPTSLSSTRNAVPTTSSNTTSPFSKIAAPQPTPSSRVVSSIPRRAALPTTTSSPYSSFNTTALDDVPSKKFANNNDDDDEDNYAVNAKMASFDMDDMTLADDMPSKKSKAKKK